MGRRPLAIDTPSSIAVLGAGPVGLEAALYARFLGYRVQVYERGELGGHILEWGHVRMFSPWRLNMSSLALAALAAQDPDWNAPPEDDCPTGREYVEQYLRPLAQTDLLADCVRPQTEVLGVGRSGLLKGDLIGDPRRGESGFRLLLRDADGGEFIDTAEVVIDATGTFGRHNRLGDGGLLALGEDAANVEYRLPDIQGERRSEFAGRHVLVVGAGYSAATNVVALAQLADDVTGTRVTWLTRGSRKGPIARIAEDRLPLRDALAVEANRLASDSSSPVIHHAETCVESVAAVDDGHGDAGFVVRCSGAHEEPLHVDRIIANVGFRPDARLYEELQVHQCYASDGPMKLAAALLSQSGSVDCLDQTTAGPESLLNPEPNFYILGAKSYGRGSQFLISLGLGQIRELFTIIGDRAELDLYSSTKNVARS